MSNSDTFFLVGLPFLIGTVWSKGVESPILMVGRGLDELEDRTTAVIEDEVDEIVDVIDVVEVVVEVEDELVSEDEEEDELVVEDQDELVEAEVEVEELVVALEEERAEVAVLDEVAVVAFAFVAVPLETVADTLA